MWHNWHCEYANQMKVKIKNKILNRAKVYCGVEKVWGEKVFYFLKVEVQGEEVSPELWIIITIFLLLLVYQIINFINQSNDPF